jgi:diguanylate cyclase (GGDEF)-like protein
MPPRDAQPVPRRRPAILRITPLALILLIATIAGFGFAFETARQADDAVESGRHQALDQAIQALQAVAPDLSGDAPRLVRVLQQASGITGLRFDDNPPDGEHDQRSLFDPKGRLIGWFSWEPERTATALTMRLLPFAAMIALGLTGVLAFATRQLRRQSELLAASEQRNFKLLHEEPLTGLPNRDDIYDRLDRALASRDDGQCVAFALIDLDGFRDAKDAIGYVHGEEAVLEIANRLRAALPPDVVIGRGRSSHKFLLLMHLAEPEAALALAEAARSAIGRPMWFGLAVQVTASVGIAVAPRDGVTHDQIAGRANLALRAAKMRGSGLVVPFAAEMEVDFEERRFIKRELGRALAARDFDVHYQPIFKADGNAIVGVEALLRWHHPTRGTIGPAVFIPVAEQAGLMDQLGEFVLRRALSDAARWPSLYVAVNLSPTQVRGRKLVDLVASVLAETNMPPSRLVLEVTEGVLIDNPEAARARLNELRALGLKLALDDFGSGYSSLTYLQRLPFDKLKVDRGFVAALDHSANAGVIIQAIIALGRALNLSILVEGIETEEQRVLVRLAGCDEMQGFLFARPAPREEIDRLLAGGRIAATGAAIGQASRPDRSQRLLSL